MGTVYCKTAKGQAELAARERRLAPRLRAALILVDGHRDEDTLRSTIPADFESTISALLDEGYIAEVVAPTSPRPSAPVPRREPSFESVRREALRALNDQLGPAAESIAIKIERTQSMAEMRPLLVSAAQALKAMRGTAAANAFVERFIPDA